jgi:hypothetical protein
MKQEITQKQVASFEATQRGKQVKRFGDLLLTEHRLLNSS